MTAANSDKYKQLFQALVLLLLGPKVKYCGLRKNILKVITRLTPQRQPKGKHWQNAMKKATKGVRYFTAIAQL